MGQSTMVATYAYVNPVVAILLGWLIAGESMTPAVVIVGSVMLITAQKSEKDSVPDDDVHESLCPSRTSPRYST